METLNGCLEKTLTQLTYQRLIKMIDPNLFTRPDPEEAKEMMNVLVGKQAQIARSICSKILSFAPKEPADGDTISEAADSVEERQKAGRQTRVLEMADGLLNLAENLRTGDLEEKDRSLFDLHDENKAAAVEHNGIVHTLCFFGENNKVDYVKLVGPPEGSV